jgi:hypothetical protein
MKNVIKPLAYIFLAILLAVGCQKLFEDDIEDYMAPHQLIEHQQNQAIAKQFNLDGSHRELVILVKQSMHNERSFEHVATSFSLENGKLLLSMKFRGTNAFGAIVTNEVTAFAYHSGEVIIIDSK